MSADPKIVPESRLIPELSYEEAAELAEQTARISRRLNTLRGVQTLAEQGATAGERAAAATADGFVYRVDMRLRPFGDSGPLVSSLDAMENYYHAQARDWERYAMVKARAISGDADEVAALMGMLRAFVYRRYIDFGVIESIRDMKRLIEAELHKKGMDANIKLGQGGIREVEFIGQAFQLVRASDGTEATPSGWQPGKKTLKPGPELVGNVWKEWKTEMAFE